MSYCRFTEADVYVFTSSEAIECCMCTLQEYEWVDDPTRALSKGYLKVVEGTEVEDSFGGPDANERMIEHLRQHRAAGHDVPDHVFERLADPEDAAQNQKYFAEAREKRAQKQDES